MIEIRSTDRCQPTGRKQSDQLNGRQRRGSQKAGCKSHRSRHPLRDIHSYIQSNQKQAVNELDMQVCPNQENQRQPIERFDAPTALCLKQQSQRDCKQSNREEEWPRSSIEQERRTHNSSANSREPESPG